MLPHKNGGGFPAVGHNARAGEVMEKTGDIYVSSEKGRCIAHYRPVDGSRAVFLCAVELSACNDHPHLREMLVELATEVALNREREAGNSMTFRVHEPALRSAAAAHFPSMRATW